MSCRNALRALAEYVGNHLVANLPSFRLRQGYYRHVLGYKLAKHCCVHMGSFFTGNFIEIGSNSILNRRCYLDGRLGVKIGSNCSISPEVYILSMKQFAEFGQQIVVLVLLQFCLYRQSSQHLQ